MLIKPIEEYKPSIDKTARRLEKTYADALEHKGGNVTFRALLPSDVSVFDEIDLAAFNYETDLDEYCEIWTRLLLKSMEARSTVADNYIPNLTIMLGIGDYSAFVEGGITFKKDTSWSTPLLKEIDDWRKLPQLGTSEWYKKFMYVCENIVKKCAEGGLPFMRGFFSPCDLAAALRGEQIYYDFYDEPEELHELLNYCADATIHFAKDIYALCDKYLGNSKYGTMYTRGVVNMSEDISCMISGKLYAEFCAPATQKVIDVFGTGHMHCHSRAMYLVKEICSLRNVTNLWLATDPNQPRPIEHIDELVVDARGTCLAIDCDSFDEIEQNSESLKKGNFSICLPVKDLNEALELTERFDRIFDND